MGIIKKRNENVLIQSIVSFQHRDQRNRQNDAGNTMEKNDAYRLKISFDTDHPRHTNY